MVSETVNKYAFETALWQTSKVYIEEAVYNNIYKEKNNLACSRLFLAPITTGAHNHESVKGSMQLWNAEHAGEIIKHKWQGLFSESPYLRHYWMWKGQLEMDDLLLLHVLYGVKVEWSATQKSWMINNKIALNSTYSDSQIVTSCVIRILPRVKFDQMAFSKHTIFSVSACGP